MSKVCTIIIQDSSCQVVLDNEESFNLPVDLFRVFKIETGTELDSIAYQQLREESERFSCYTKALAYLAIKNRSSKEIENYLRKRNFSGYAIQQAITKLHEKNYISDYDYALDFIKATTNKKTVGQEYLKAKLYAKGIPRHLIKNALKETDSEQDDIEAVYALAKKKFLLIKHKSNPIKKIELFLLQRGFNRDIIHKVITMLNEKFSLSQDEFFTD